LNRDVSLNDLTFFITHNPTFFRLFFYLEIHLFFRFIAEIRPSGNRYLPKGDITGFTELLDYGDIFNPTTGRLTTNEEGDFILHVSAMKPGGYGKRGEIHIYKNQYLVQKIIEGDEEYSLMINSVFTLHLQKGDEVKLYNVNDESILVSSYYYAFIFTGYKI